MHHHNFAVDNKQLQYSYKKLQLLNVSNRNYVFVSLTLSYNAPMHYEIYVEIHILYLIAYVKRQ